MLMQLLLAFVLAKLAVEKRALPNRPAEVIKKSEMAASSHSISRSPKKAKKGAAGERVSGDLDKRLWLMQMLTGQRYYIHTSNSCFV